MKRLNVKDFSVTPVEILNKICNYISKLRTEMVTPKISSGWPKAICDPGI